MLGGCNDVYPYTLCLIAEDIEETVSCAPSGSSLTRLGSLYWLRIWVGTFKTCACSMSNYVVNLLYIHLPHRGQGSRGFCRSQQH
jgi:hypothetical protein